MPVSQMRHGLATLWFHFTSLVALCLCRRKSPKPDTLPMFLPTLHPGGMAPANSSLILQETATTASDAEVIDIRRQTWISDAYSLFKRDTLHVTTTSSPGGMLASNYVNLKRAHHLPPRTHAVRNHKRRVRIFSKGYGGVAKPISPVKSSPFTAAREWASLGIASSSGPGSLTASESHSDLSSSDSISTTSSGASSSGTTIAPHANRFSETDDIVVISPSLSSTLLPRRTGSAHGQRIVIESTSGKGDRPRRRATPPLLFSHNTYAINPLSAVSSRTLWDAAQPTHVLRSIPVPQLSDSPATYIKKSKSQHETRTNTPARHFGPRTPRSEEKALDFSELYAVSLDYPSMSIGGSPPFKVSAADANTPGATGAAALGSVTPPKDHSHSVRSPGSPLVSPPRVMGKNMLLFKSTSKTHAVGDGPAAAVIIQGDEEGELSSFECTEEEFLNLFMTACK